jgi:hypothetical protein
MSARRDGATRNPRVNLERIRAVRRDPISPQMNQDAADRHGIGPIDHVGATAAAQNTFAIGPWHIEANRKRGDSAVPGVSYDNVDTSFIRNRRDVLQACRENARRGGLSGRRGAYGEKKTRER